MEMYNHSKSYKIGLFVLNNTATNLGLFLLGFYAFYGQNLLGLSAIIIGLIATSMRIFDGITDPIIGYFIDKTDGKFGKFKPFILTGNIIILLSVIAIFNTPLYFSSLGKYIWTTSFYIIYIIGYTFQTACTKGGQVVLTNDPKQRPLFSIFDTIYNTILFGGGTYLLMSVIAPRYESGLLNPELWRFVSLITALASFVCTVLAIIGIWEKDRREFFGVDSEAAKKIKGKDYLDIIKNNKAIQMLVIAASTDKLASSTMRGVEIYLFANIILNQKLQGNFSATTAIPITIVGVTGLYFARKSGLKKIFKFSTWGGLLSSVLLFFIGMKGNNINLFLGFMFVLKGFMAISTPIVIPMIADVTDYELHRSGRFVPGMMGTLFSFVDKMISSLATTLVGFSLAYAGVGKSIIQPNVFISEKFKIVMLVMYCLVPMLAFVASLISMRYYKLDKNRMEEIQLELNLKKNELNDKDLYENDNLELV